MVEAGFRQREKPMCSGPWKYLPLPGRWATREKAQDSTQPQGMGEPQRVANQGTMAGWPCLILVPICLFQIQTRPCRLASAGRNHGRGRGCSTVGG